MVLLPLGKCGEEYFASFLLKQVPFNIRVTFSKTQSLAQKVVLGKSLCQPFDSCRFSGEGEDQPQHACSWLSFHDVVTVRNSCMQEMLLNILQLQVESRDSSCRRLPFLPVEWRFTQMCLRLLFLDLSLLNLFACAYRSIQLLLHYGRSAESHLVSQNSDTL